VRVLLCFDDPDGLRLLLARLAAQPNFTAWSDQLFFAPLSVVREQFFEGWQRLDGLPATLY
jgi:hypothetical protein